MTEPDCPSAADEHLTDFFDSDSGFSKPYYADSRKLKLLDWIHDAQLALSFPARKMRQAARSHAIQRILIVGVKVPSRVQDIHSVISHLSRDCKHEITTSIVPMGDAGKFTNIDKAIAQSPKPIGYFDWIIVTDDDISFETGFVDRMIYLASQADLSLSQPAHAYRSHTTYALTKRHWKSLTRETKFVEIGPLTLIRADAFSALIPFPESRYCYGIDLLWPDLMEAHHLKMGIIDGTPIRHLRPIAVSYQMSTAIDEGRRFIAKYQIRRPRKDFFSSAKVVIRS